MKHEAGEYGVNDLYEPCPVKTGMTRAIHAACRPPNPSDNGENGINKGEL